MAQAGVFAVIAPFLAEDEDVIAVHLGAASVPTLGPITLFAPADAQTRPAIFNLSAGLDDQVRALVDYATKHLLLGTVPMAVLAPSDSRYAPAAAAAEAQRARQGGAPVLRLTYAVPDDAKGLVEGMSRLGVETVIYLGAPSSLANLLQAARHAAWRPTVLASGSSVDRSIVAMPALGGPTLYAAYPLLRSDQSPAGAVEFRRLHEQSGIPDRHVPVQILAFAATKLFLEAARRAGRALTRERLVTILEDMRSFDTGVLRPLTYGPGRRVGTLGAHIVPIEFAGTTLSNDRLWIVPDPL